MPIDDSVFLDMIILSRKQTRQQLHGFVRMDHFIKYLLQSNFSKVLNIYLSFYTIVFLIRPLNLVWFGIRRTGKVESW